MIATTRVSTVHGTLRKRSINLEFHILRSTSVYNVLCLNSHFVAVKKIDDH